MPSIYLSPSSLTTVMALVVLVWGCLLQSALSRVVHQADGIVSIITELEPDRTPVGYLQAVNRSPPPGTGRGVPVVVRTEQAPLEEGQFRVSSEKIQVVDAKTGSTADHKTSDSKTEVKKDEDVSTDEDNDQKEVKADSTDQRETYPDQKLNDGNRVGDSTYRVDYSSREQLPKKSKPGKYGYQTPRGGNSVRIDKTKNHRENYSPEQDYSHTIVRPVNPREDFVTSKRKSGKPGRYVTFSPPSREFDRIPSNRDNNSNKFKKETLSLKDPQRRKVEKEYSSNTVLRYPDGSAQENERRVESSTKYRTGSKERTNLRPSQTSLRTRNEGKFNGRYYPSSIYDKLEYDQSIEEASSIVDGSLRGADSLIEDSYPGEVGYYGGDSRGDYGGLRGGYGKEKHFENAGGKDFRVAHSSAHGSKGEKGYSDDASFVKEQSEKHGRGEDKDYSKEKEDDEKSHLDKTSQFASGHQGSEGVKGEDYHKDKGHRKGHKKSGYRSVVHKDEYKNKEEFYDEEHDSGEKKEHGHKSHHHSGKAGGQGVKQHLDAGHHEAHRGAAGGHEKGHGYKHQKGYHKDHGHSGHYGHQDEYGKKSGHKAGEFHGHSEFGGYE